MRFGVLDARLTMLGLRVHVTSEGGNMIITTPLCAIGLLQLKVKESSMS